ncbi:MFS transporter, partial [Klebsiella quasipneumoniae]
TRQCGFIAQMGKNEAFNNAGYFFTAMIAGASAWDWGSGGIFILRACTTLCTLIALLAIRSSDNDDDAARGLESAIPPALPGFAILVRHT